MWSSISLQYWLALPWWLVMSSTLSCAGWPFAYLLWRNVSSGSLPLFDLGFLVIVDREEFFMYAGHESLIRCIICKCFLALLCCLSPLLSVSSDAHEPSLVAPNPSPYLPPPLSLRFPTGSADAGGLPGPCVLLPPNVGTVLAVGGGWGGGGWGGGPSSSLQRSPSWSPNILEAKDNILPGEFADSFKKNTEIGCVLISGSFFFFLRKSSPYFFKSMDCNNSSAPAWGKGLCRRVIDWQQGSKIKRQVSAWSLRGEFRTQARGPASGAAPSGKPLVRVQGDLGLQWEEEENTALSEPSLPAVLWAVTSLPWASRKIKSLIGYKILLFCYMIQFTQCFIRIIQFNKTLQSKALCKE